MKTFKEFMQEKNEGVLLGPKSRRVTDPAPAPSGKKAPRNYQLPPPPKKPASMTNLAVPKDYEPKPGSRVRRAK